MISHEHKCVYIHIPKTAGTSVEKHFGVHENADLRLFGKPVSYVRRRMGVALAFSDSVDDARVRARLAASKITTVQG